MAWDGCDGSDIVEMVANHCWTGLLSNSVDSCFTEDGYVSFWKMRRDACHQELCEAEAALGCVAYPDSADFQAADLSCDGDNEETSHDSLQGRLLNIDSPWGKEEIYFADFGPIDSFRSVRLPSGGFVLAWLHEGSIGFYHSSFAASTAGWNWQAEPVLSEGVKYVALLTNGGGQPVLFASREDSLLATVLADEEDTSTLPYQVSLSGQWNGGAIEVKQLASGPYVLATGSGVSGCQSGWDIWLLSERMDSASQKVSLLPSGDCIGMVSMVDTAAGAVVIWDEWTAAGVIEPTTSESRLLALQLDSEGTAIGEPVVLVLEERICDHNGCFRPSIASLGDVGFVLVWISDGADTKTAKARLLGPDLATIGESFSVNLRGDVVSPVAIVSEPSREEFMATWVGCSIDSVPFPDVCEVGTSPPFLEACAVFGQRFNKAGGRLWKRCNNGVCDEDEDCSSCPKDCGICN